jgi:hypothetical protein
MTQLSSDPHLRESVADPLPAQSCPACGGQSTAPKAKRGDSIPSIGAILLAFLASQHHNLMMALFAFGLSDLAMSFMTAVPIVRNVMLGLSLAMVAVIVWQIRDPARPRSVRIMGAVSVAATIGLSAWSITQFGW